MCFFFITTACLGEEMDNFFYEEWLLIGQPEHRYSKPFPIVKLSPSDDVKTSILINPEPGHRCRYANRLRNSNAYQDINISDQTQVKLNKISSSKVESLYMCGNNLLIQNYDSWVLLDNKTLEKISEGEWYENGSTFFSVGSKFFAIQRKLDEISSKGELLSRTRGMWSEDLIYNEIAYIKDKVIIAGYQTHPNLPEPVAPFGFLQSIPGDGFTEPNPKNMQRKIEKSNTISFFEDIPNIPIYLDEKVIQPLVNRIAIFNYDMEVIRVIEGDFDPAFLSAGLDSIIYMLGIKKNSHKLYAFDEEGHLIYENDIPKGLGDVAAPPLVSPENEIFLIGKRGIAFFDKAGKLLWTHKIEGNFNSPIFPLLYNDILTVCYDSECKAFNRKGEVVFGFDKIEGNIKTPLISVDNGNYFIGTDIGLYRIYQTDAPSLKE